MEASLAPFAVEDARSANGSTGGAIAAAQGELYELRVVLPSRDRLLTDLVRTCYSLGQPSRGSDWCCCLLTPEHLDTAADVHVHRSVLWQTATLAELKLDVIDGDIATDDKGRAVDTLRIRDRGESARGARHGQNVVHHTA